MPAKRVLRPDFLIDFEHAIAGKPGTGELFISWKIIYLSLVLKEKKL